MLALPLWSTQSSAGNRQPYICNVCGRKNEAALHELTREGASCRRCGSTVRMRSMVHLLSMHLFGESLALPHFPKRPDIHGFGLSDWVGYAKPLAKRLSYTNTFYHRDPFLDITKIPVGKRASCDFLIATDVFEHVLPPVQLAFDGARQLLKPGGVFVFSVPFMHDQYETIEHFPELHDFTIHTSGGQHRLHNVTKSGHEQWFDQLIYHGGPGSTLEMRVFAQEALIAHFKAAGFSEVKICGEDFLPAGIHWSDPWSVPMVAVA